MSVAAPKARWAQFQNLSGALIAAGVVFTLVYIGVTITPKLGGGLHASPLVPDWPTINVAVLLVHIATAIPPLVIGLVAFSPKARRASWRFHRWIGTAYCVTIWISAVTGGLLALANQFGLMAKAGFFTLAVVWFTSTWFAYTTARNKDFVAHRNWMIRSYAVTLAVVSVRPMFIFGPPFGMDYETYYPLVTWMCWVPNLIIGEIYLRSTRHSGALDTKNGLPAHVAHLARNPRGLLSRADPA